ncbi:MAG: hypothetical protein KF850_33040 [Labilithrix sp.]|nr:hypothetical protein [Labilithrix sp.]
MTSLAKVLARIDALDDDFAFFSSQAKPPKAAAIAALEKKLGMTLAPVHRELIEELGACAIVADEKVWRRPAPYQVIPLWKHHWGIEVFGVASKAALDVVKQTKARAPAGVVAAMGRSGGTTVGYDKKGRLFEWAEGDKPSPIKAKNLLALLDEWLRTIADDKAKLKTKVPGEVWLDKLTDDESDDRTAARLLKEKPAVRAAVVDLVVKRIAAGDDEVTLLHALGKIAKDDKALSALRTYALKGKTDEIREVAIGVLGSSEIDAKHVVPTLLACLRESNADVIGRAAEELANYAEPSMVKPLVAALAKVQKNKRWVHGVAAGYVFAALAAASRKAKGKDLDTIIDTLSANLAPRDKYAALPAFESLIAVGPKARRAVPALEKAVAGKDLYLGLLARRALGAITGDWKPHLDALKAAAKSRDSAVSSVADEGLDEARKKKR